MSWLSEILRKIGSDVVKLPQWERAKVQRELFSIDAAQERRDVRLTDAEKRLTVLEGAAATSLLHQQDRVMHRRPRTTRRP